ncbi:uncharacterized protein LOC136082577 [Hydra vulgaris]|uniref:Uncharacterized protein LOC136082577 n=1 Tax=Hydra vulgaris TaxID=6087 RepID=A0ABM4C8X1_HYDVU
MVVDGLHPRVFKNCSEAFLISITLIFKQSIVTRSVLVLWRPSKITPIFKKDCKLKASDYRPVSLTSVPFKIMEGILYDHVIKHCLEDNLLTQNRHGFIPNKSCVTNLLET